MKRHEEGQKGREGGCGPVLEDGPRDELPGDTARPRATVIFGLGLLPGSSLVLPQAAHP